MRLLIKLYSKSNFPYENEYHYNLQGFIYNLLRNSRYHPLHNKKGYKFFCFSNIFPYSKYIRKDDLRYLAISSPDNLFLDFLFTKLDSISHNTINIGNMEFELVSIEKKKIIIPSDKPFSLITGTPLIIRIPSNRFKQYEQDLVKQYRYIYWKKSLPITFFISQIQNTIIKKYNDYYNYNNRISTNLNIDHFFERFIFKKQISTKIRMKESIQTVIGTLWEFEFEGWENKDILEFIVDTGLGERNSLGFGFMNLVTKLD